MENYDLLYPQWYGNLTPDFIKTIIGKGGCGPGVIGDRLVPDKLLGVCITPACRIHDLMYYYSVNDYDKKKADSYFLYNMVQIIDCDSANSFTRWLRLKLAFKYFLAVMLFGKCSTGGHDVC
jgi:hypothetical protein